MSDSNSQAVPGHLKSTFPVLLPEDPALLVTTSEFESFLRQTVKPLVTTVSTDEPEQVDTSVANLKSDVDRMKVSSHVPSQGHPFMQGLSDTNEPQSRNMVNMMHTDNDDLAYRSTTSALVDLFAELEEVVDGERLATLLDQAWNVDAEATLKIIFNARSIHLGKSSRITTYKCFGWLAQKHPLTLLLNLQWLTRPIIEKKLVKKDGDEDDMVFVEAEVVEDDITRFDVKNGVAHGYWKDLLNILVLAAGDKFDGLADPRQLLNIENKTSKKNVIWDQKEAKGIRETRKSARYNAVLVKLKDDAFYEALHMTVARLFAEQLKKDLALLRSGDAKACRQISLCGKWAPSLGVFHDKHTFITSSIAEILHPRSEFSAEQDREIYLRNAREAYRKDISALRKALEVVEREISSEKFQDIKYDRLPSLAMNRYAGLFAEKDTDRFEQYIRSVAEGKKQISGATLLPSGVVAAIRQTSRGYQNVVSSRKRKSRKGTKALMNEKMQEMDAKVLDGQWNALVKRIKDNGTLESSIAVCDVSGSMSSPVFPDGTCPMDSSIGLSLLVAEVTAPPFGGGFITFSSKPHFQKIEGTTLKEKINNMEHAHWECSTDFVAVFTKLILPMARDNKLTQEQMVKQIFVFSDMQFDSAETVVGKHQKYTTSYERIKKDFERYGYQMPRLVFWNLAGGRAGYGEMTAPKPVTADEQGTSLVSGYSQGLLKVFLDNGSFDADEVEEEVVEEEKENSDKGDDFVDVKVTKKVKTDPLTTVKKAISHKAYSMLKVYD